MKRIYTAYLFCAVILCNTIRAQQPVDRPHFFADTSMVNATLKFNIGRLIRHKDVEGELFPASFSCTLPDGTQVNDKINVEVRGHFRRSYCYIPPLRLIFNADDNAVLHKLKSLKLVSACRPAGMYDQFLLKEYLIYKIYNLITDKSYRVRLLNLGYADSSGKQKTTTDHAFLLEDEKDLAKRNDCKEWEGQLPYESADRRQMTIVAIFEYMIGNTDWSVPGNHNIKTIISKTDSFARPYVVPYDFDYSGLVSTNYSAPNENLGIENVQQRLYRGFPRTMNELNDVLDVFKKQKENIYALIKNFDLLTASSKKEMTNYLDDFFSTISDQRSVKDVFIDNARTQ